MKVQIEVGDTVYVWKSRPGEGEKEATGVITKIRMANPTRTEVLVNGEWWYLRNDLRNRVQLIQKGHAI